MRVKQCGIAMNETRRSRRRTRSKHGVGDNPTRFESSTFEIRPSFCSSFRMLRSIRSRFTRAFLVVCHYYCLLFSSVHLPHPSQRQCVRVRSKRRPDACHVLLHYHHSTPRSLSVQPRATPVTTFRSRKISKRLRALLRTSTAHCRLAAQIRTICWCYGDNFFFL